MARKSVVRRRAEPQGGEPNYWTRFLASRNIIGIVSDEDLEEEESSTPSITGSGSRRELSGDMLTFVYRVAERLTPIDGLNEDARRRALRIREQFRRELTNVFIGKEDFNDWFSRTKTQLGLHLMTITKILYECLEGLRSQEAVELRAEYGRAMRRIGET